MKKKWWRYAVGAVVLALGFYAVVSSSKDLVKTGSVQMPPVPVKGPVEEEQRAPSSETEAMLAELRTLHESGEPEQVLHEKLHEKRWAVEGQTKTFYNENGIPFPFLDPGTQKPQLEVNMWCLNNMIEPREWVLFVSWKWWQKEGGVGSYDLVSLDFDDEHFQFRMASPNGNRVWLSHALMTDSMIFNLKDHTDSAAWVELYQTKSLEQLAKEHPEMKQPTAYLGYRYGRTYLPGVDSSAFTSGPNLQFGGKTEVVGTEFRLEPNVGTEEKVWLAPHYTVAGLR